VGLKVPTAQFRLTISWGNFLIFAISVGFPTGVLGINISHELIHKPNASEKYLGKALLSMVCYGHWYTEHLWGHHKVPRLSKKPHNFQEVSTPHDPATSKLGETFYSFWPRSVIGSFKSAWALEESRAEKKGSPVFSINSLIAARIPSLVSPKRHHTNGNYVPLPRFFRFSSFRRKGAHPLRYPIFYCLFSFRNRKLHRTLWS
jgi:hypothetical protein